MKKLIFLVMILLLAYSVNAAYYVIDPNNCPATYQSQTCSGSDVVCGSSGGVTFCYNPLNIDPPTVNRTIQTTNYACQDGTCDGGYVIDCYYYDGSEPHCDNGNTGFCDRNSTCYNKHVQTTCLEDIFVSSTCSESCISGYVSCDGSSTDPDGCEVQYGVTSCSAGANNNINSSCGCVCDSSYLDCDGSGPGVGTGCEVENGGSCSVGSLSGTYSGCTCVVDKSYFETGTLIEYQTNDSQSAMLWFKNYAENGNLLNATNSNNESFIINASGCIRFMDGTWQCNASENIIDSGLYNSSEMLEQGDGNLGIIDSFIQLLITNQVTQSFIQALGFYNSTQVYSSDNVQGGKADSFLCLQEFVNGSNSLNADACYINESGNYGCDGTFDDSCSYAYDGDVTTRATVAVGNEAAVSSNYSVQSFATGAFWSIDYGTGGAGHQYDNLTIPEECRNESYAQLRANLTQPNPSNYVIDFYCMNNTQWSLLSQKISSNGLWEEQLLWDLSSQRFLLDSEQLLSVNKATNFLENTYLDAENPTTANGNITLNSNILSNGSSRLFYENDVLVVER